MGKYELIIFLTSCEGLCLYGGVAAEPKRAASWIPGRPVAKKRPFCCVVEAKQEFTLKEENHDAI